MSGNCPNCGAPITGKVCEYCGTQHAKEVEQVTIDVSYDRVAVRDWAGHAVYMIENMPNVRVRGL